MSRLTDAMESFIFFHPILLRYELLRHIGSLIEDVLGLTRRGHLELGLLKVKVKGIHVTIYDDLICGLLLQVLIWQTLILSSHHLWPKHRGSTLAEILLGL